MISNIFSQRSSHVELDVRLATSYANDLPRKVLVQTNLAPLLKCRPPPPVNEFQMWLTFFSEKSSNENEKRWILNETSARHRQRLQQTWRCCITIFKRREVWDQGGSRCRCFLSRARPGDLPTISGDDDRVWRCFSIIQSWFSCALAARVVFFSSLSLSFCLIYCFLSRCRVTLLYECECDLSRFRMLLNVWGDPREASGSGSE